MRLLAAVAATVNCFVPTLEVSIVAPLGTGPPQLGVPAVEEAHEYEATSDWPCV